MSGVYFGDIGVAWITNKSTDISKDVVEKNFVDSPPQVYELTSDLESGTYSLIFHESIHPRSESFEEQRDGVRSMASRPAPEFPFELAGDKGHIVPENTSVSITPSEEIEEGEITLRFLESEKYEPAFKLEANRINENFDVGTVESILPIPDIATNKPTADYTISSEEGTFDYYIYSDKIISYSLPSDYTKIERINPVRLYDGSDKRIYSDKGIKSGSYIDNGLIRTTYNTNTVDLEYYDGSWTNIGEVNVPEVTDGYSKNNENYRVTVDMIDSHTSTVYRGHPVTKFTVDGLTQFKFDTQSEINTTNHSDSWYRIVEDVNGQELFVIRTSTDGSWNVSNESIVVSNIDNNFEYEFVVGAVPSGIPSTDFVRYMYNIGLQKRTFTQV